MAAVLAQVPPPQLPVSIPPPQLATLRGVLLELDAGVEGGEISVRGSGNEVVRYRFDAKTRVERAGMAATLRLLLPGEPVEVQSHPIADSPLRYATAVLALDRLAPPQIVRRPRAPASAMPAASVFPRAELTFSGVVSFLGSGRFILQMRNSGEETILLRSDTRYLAGGAIVAGSTLKANMRVFVRAGKDLFGHTEAYQVMWGGFLQPPNQ